MWHAARQFAHDVWSLARPYWSSDDRWVARGLLAALVALNLAIVYVEVLFNEWNNAFYNAVQDRNEDAFWSQMGIFCVLAAAFIVLSVYQLYLNQMLQIRWRRWLTDAFLTRWLAGRSYYRLQLTDRGTDNPDQRIAEDLRLFVDATLSLSLGALKAAVTLISFLGILWALSGPLPFGDGSVEIPGYMVWVAIVYAIGGTWITHLIGRPLVMLNNSQQSFEADFRFALVRFRENAEGVALYRGERDEARNFAARFATLADNWWAIMKRQKTLGWFTNGYAQIAIVFPFVVVAPRYFSGAVQLGDMMQTASAFGQVQGALSWFITAYTQLAEWKATTDRLIGFREAIARAEEDAAAPGGIAVIAGGPQAVDLAGLELALPDGRVLVADARAHLAAGEPVLVTGPSGSGKSTLFRALAGIWPFGKGRIIAPGAGHVLFLPQRPYLPVGALRAVVAYPSGADDFSNAAIAEALMACGLPQLAGRLDEAHNWALRLSPGGQQRIAFARALLHKPAWLFLDEATSALDERSEATLYRLLAERLPQTTLVSIGHRPTLAAFHRRRLAIERPDDGPGRLVPSPAAQAAS